MFVTKRKYNEDIRNRSISYNKVVDENIRLDEENRKLKEDIKGHYSKIELQKKEIEKYAFDNVMLKDKLKYLIGLLEKIVENQDSIDKRLKSFEEDNLLGEVLDIKNVIMRKLNKIYLRLPSPKKVEKPTTKKKTA